MNIQFLSRWLLVAMLGWAGWTGLNGQFNALSNAEFALGLAAWEATGAVFGTGGQAVVTDQGAPRSLLYQGAPLAAGLYAVAFDFRGLLSAAEPVGFAKDTFFASLYFSDAPGLFDPAVPAGFTGSLALLDVDAVRLDAFSGVVEPSPLGGGFQRYSGQFALASPATVYVVFDLVGLNGIDDDSVVLVDNVVLAVPEPLAALPLGILSALWAVFARRRR